MVRAFWGLGESPRMDSGCKTLTLAILHREKQQAWDSRLGLERRPARNWTLATGPLAGWCRWPEAVP